MGCTDHFLQCPLNSVVSCLIYADVRLHIPMTHHNDRPHRYSVPRICNYLGRVLWWRKRRPASRIFVRKGTPRRLHNARRFSFQPWRETGSLAQQLLRNGFALRKGIKILILYRSIFAHARLSRSLCVLAGLFTCLETPSCISRRDKTMLWAWTSRR